MCETCGGHGHTHDHDSEHVHSHDHNHDGEHVHSHDHAHQHTHEDGQQHEHEHTHVHSHEHSPNQGHGHIHTEEENKAVLNRLARAIGHLESIKRMVADGRDCSDVLIQLSAVRSAINGVGKLVLQNHIEHCIVDAIKSNEMDRIKELEFAIDRFVK